MSVFGFNRIRKYLSTPGHTDGVFRNLTSSLDDAEWIVKLYYAASVYFTAQLLTSVDDIAKRTDAWDFLWPLAWLEGRNIDFSLQLLSVACFLSSLIAFQFYRNIVARIIFSVLFLVVATVPNSLGGINHPYHAWMWVGFVFIFLPDGNIGQLDRGGKLAYLTVIRMAQAMFLLTYSMSGAWKVYFGTIDALAGRTGNFSPQALSWTLADRVLQTGTDPLFADVLIRNYWLAWPMFLLLIYIQVVSIAISFRPRLHLVWGYLLIGFHLGTWLLMKIMFSEQVLLLIILLVLSPQRRALSNPVEALRDLPMVGWAFRRHRNLRAHLGVTSRFRT